MSVSSLFLVICAVLLTLSTVNAADPAPIQHRIALIPNGMTVSWSTIGNLSTVPAIAYGLSSSNLTTVVHGETQWYDPSISWFHHVALKNLKPSTTYFWQVITPMNSSSPIYQFTTAPVVGTNVPVSIDIYGDLGIDNSDKTVALLRSRAKADALDFFWHIGDLSYANDHSRTNYTYEEIQEAWMNNMTQVWDQRPYMFCPGNHENTCGGTGCTHGQKNFTSYRRRFHMPYAYSGSESNMMYSFDYGLAHIVNINTETDFPDAPEGSEAGPFSPSQSAWLEADLTRAVANRATVPWILVSGHRPFYSSAYKSGESKNAIDYFEDIFIKYNVDIVFVGHIHFYERMYPISKDKRCSDNYVNATCPIYIISGAAGNIEGLSHVDSPLNPFTAVQLSTYGIGNLKILNRTNLHWEFIQSSDAKVLDQVDIVQMKYAQLPAQPPRFHRFPHGN